jgi:ubiquinone/menaquinone biosynthesis C-methylase UbiE
VRLHAVARTKDTGLSAPVAYDVIAGGYDEQVRGDTWMRLALHAHYQRVFRPGARVLDVGCGTGTDALALAGMGVRVLGIDASSAMIDRFRDKTAQAGLADVVNARVLSIEDLGSLTEAGFDGIVSAFASLNSLSDLHGFARDAARLVRPGGRMVLHALNRFSLWEFLGYVRQRDWSAARNVGRQRMRPFVIGGQSVEHRLYFAMEAYSRFEPWFGLRAAYGLGALRPPHTVRRIALGLVDALEWLDLRLGRWPVLRNAGRFFVLDLERRSA